MTRLGTKLAVAGTWRSGLSASQQWVPTVARDLSYVASCSCYKYMNAVNRRL